jgi:hypothetical protein
VNSYILVAERNSATDPELPDYHFVARSDAEAFDAIRVDLRSRKESSGDIEFHLYRTTHLGSLYGPEFLEDE